MTIELPWVAEIQHAPAVFKRKNPVWGILALAAAVWSLICLVIGIATAFSSVEFFFLSLPFWGIVSLGALGLALVAVVKRGKFNLIAGWVCVVLAVLSNPALAYAVIIWTMG